MTVLLTLEASQPSGNLSSWSWMQLASGFDDRSALTVVLIDGRSLSETRGSFLFRMSHRQHVPPPPDLDSTRPDRLVVPLHPSTICDE
jgi:hypothetical protein